MKGAREGVRMGTVRRGGRVYPPGGPGVFVGDLDAPSERTRQVVVSPAEALAAAERDLDEWNSYFAIPGFPVEFFKGTGIPASDMKWVGYSMERRIDALRAGKRAAERMLSCCDEYSIGGLRLYLRENPPTPEAIFWLMAAARRQGVRKAASIAATKKNEEPRRFVAEAWRSRKDVGQSKASFARMFAPLVKMRFGVSVTPDRIARHWLE